MDGPDGGFNDDGDDYAEYFSAPPPSADGAGTSVGGGSVWGADASEGGSGRGIVAAPQGMGRPEGKWEEKKRGTGMRMSGEEEVGKDGENINMEKEGEKEKKKFERMIK